MTEELAKDAVKQGRASVVAIVATCLIWLLTSGTVRSSLLLDAQARELAAWLVLRELLPQSIAPDLYGLSREDPVTCIPKLIPVQSGTEVEDCVPIIMHLPWLGETTQEVQLNPIPNSQFGYRIEKVQAELPITEYSIGISEGERVWIFPTDVPLDDLRDMFNAAERDDKAVPRGWAAMRVTLRSRGWSGESAEDLRLGDQVVAQFLNESFTKTYSISGVSVSARLFPVAVNIVLGALAFLLFGPVIALHRTSSVVIEDAWVMLAQPTGWTSIPLRASKVLAIAVVTLMPLLVALSQWQLMPLLRPREALLLASTSLAAIAAVFAVLLFASAVVKASHRTSTGKVPSDTP